MSEPDEAGLAHLANALADGIEEALPRWIERSVERILLAWCGERRAGPTFSARLAGERAAREVGAEVRALLSLDVDDQAVNPLSLLRGAVRYPTAVLQEAGVPPVVRDQFVEERFPADLYDLAPAGFADIDPSLQDPGLAWGAAKAFVILSRRRTTPGR